MNEAKTALLCAYTLARAHRYADAEDCLFSSTEVSKTVEATDLLARIRMEQGDVAEARRLWQSIQSIRPEHEPSRIALRNIGRPSHGVSTRTKVFCAALLALLIGGAAGFFCSPKAAPKVAEIAWPGIPNTAAIEALAPYRGNVAQVTLSSAFFADPKRVANRQILTQLLSDALALAPADIYLGEAAEGQDGESITVRLALKPGVK